MATAEPLKNRDDEQLLIALLKAKYQPGTLAAEGLSEDDYWSNIITDIASVALGLFDREWLQGAVHGHNAGGESASYDGDAHDRS